MAASNDDIKLFFTYISLAGILLMSVEATSWKVCIEFYISNVFVGIEVLILLCIGIGLSLMISEFKMRRLFHPLPHIIGC